MVDTRQIRTSNQLVRLVWRTRTVNDFPTEFPLRDTGGVRTSDRVERVVALHHLERRTVVVVSYTSVVPAHEGGLLGTGYLCAAVRQLAFDAGT
jgi:hypothetical protein